MRYRLILILLSIMLLAGCSAKGEIKYEYGVFLGIDSSDIGKIQEYKIIVIDAQNFTKEEISELKESGHTVYSYINIGSVEDFRPYYDRFKDITLGDYENWEEEKWVDVSKPEWQTFILDELSVGILDKGVDGFFVDNCDVYYNYPDDEIFGGVADILKGLKGTGEYVSINGGDAFVTKYEEKFDTLDDIMDAVNQETIFSRIDWDEDSFSANPDDEREYFQEYAELVSSYGKDVFLLEYTTDKALIKDISEYCSEHGFKYYAADKLELLTPDSDNGSQGIK